MTAKYTEGQMQSPRPGWGGVALRAWSRAEFRTNSVGQGTEASRSREAEHVPETRNYKLLEPRGAMPPSNCSRKIQHVILSSDKLRRQNADGVCESCICEVNLIETFRKL